MRNNDETDCEGDGGPDSAPEDPDWNPEDPEEEETLETDDLEDLEDDDREDELGYLFGDMTSDGDSVDSN